MAHSPHHRTGASHGFAITMALLGACGLALPACAPRAPAEARTTDADFEALRARRGPVSLIAPDEPNGVDADTQQRIAESISLLDNYFAKSNQPGGGVSPGGSTAYDPSAERGPTGTGSLARPGAAEPAMVARAGDVRSPATTRSGEPGPSPEQRLLSGFDMVRTDSVDPRQAGPAADGGQIVVTIGSPVFAPNFSWPTTPGGMGIVTADSPSGFDDDGFGGEADGGLGTAVASADGSLPGIPGVNGDPGTLSAGPAGTGGAGVTPEQRKSELVEELVGILTRVAKSHDDPYQAGLALAGLETLSPGALYELVDSGALLPNETEILLAAHEFFQGLAADPMQASTENAMTLVDRVREKLNETAPLRITAAELCTRVWGYGQYETFDKASDGSYRFMVGRRQPIIIYTEVDRFGRSPVVDGDGVSQWKVELSQELQVFHLADDLLVTARSAETDTSLSRSKMRDYYLINQTYLPETLTLGKYHLKIVMRDANKDAIAEAVIPFQIVASSTLDGD